MESASPWSPDVVLAGKYRLLERLGAGGMGEVWAAEHLSIGTVVAIKLLHVDVHRRPELLGRFEREARAAAALESPHVVKVFDHGVAGDVPFIVMERLVGRTLAARLDEEGALPGPCAARIVTHLASALSAAHAAGIVHRDVKPENVFLVPGAEGEVAKLLDFGIAKVTAEIASKAAPTRTRSGALLGTPLYMSPEQLRERPVDLRSDLWSLALVAFECVTGSTAFAGESVAEIISEVLSGPLPTPSHRAPVPRGFDAWFERAARREPQERFASAREMAEAFAVIAAGEMVVDERADGRAGGPAKRVETSPGVTSSLPTVRPPSRRPGAAWLAASVVLGVSVIVGGLVASRGDADVPLAQDPPAPAVAEAVSARTTPPTSPAPGDSSSRLEARDPPPAVASPVPRPSAPVPSPRAAPRSDARRSPPAAVAATPSPSASGHVLAF